MKPTRSITSLAVGFVVTTFIVLPGLAGLSINARELSLEQRVKAQEAIERVYYRDQIGSTRAFEDAVPRTVLDRKVATYLKQTVALQTLWKIPVTGEMLTQERLRLKAESRAPERLRALYAALGDDGFLVEECLARATLVDRLARGQFGLDESLHARQRQEAEDLRLRLVRAGAGQIGAVRSERDAFVISVVLEERAASARKAYFAVPKLAWDDWWNGVKASFDPREVHAVADPRDRPTPATASVLSAGTDDAWDDGSLDDRAHPPSDHAKVWTGSLLVVWGGRDGLVLNTGRRYDPATNSWTAMSTENAPAACEHPSGIWTGSVVVFRGTVDARSETEVGRYDPATDTWSGPVLDPNADAVDATGTPVDPTPVDVAPIDAAPPGQAPTPTAAEEAVDVAETGPLFPPISTTWNGLRFPTSTPVVTDIFLGSQGMNFGYCQAGPNAGLACANDSACPGSACEKTFDNTFCLSYNASCSGARTNKAEHAFNDVLETTYDHSPAAGRQTWVERNWNYFAADGTYWRPFSFVLDVDANSTCVGGTNQGAFCTRLDAAGVCTGGGTCTGAAPTGAAWWTFKPNNRDGNSSLILRWPWATINARDGTDPFWINGFSTWMRTSDFNSGTTTSGARFATYVDHANDRQGPWINGVASTVDFNAANVNGKVSVLNAAYFDARISGQTPSRVINSLTGVRSEVNLASTGNPQSLAQSFGVLVGFNPSGTSIVDSSHTGILIETPSLPGAGTRITTQNGLWVADQQLVRSGGGGSAILISSQTASDGTEGNLRMDGGNWNTGHIQLFQGHLWRDATRKVLRFSCDAAPGSESGGNALVMGTGSDSHGVVLWGVTTATSSSFDTGNEVCAASGAGLTCVSTNDLGSSSTAISCSTAHTQSARWLAFCK